MSVAVECKAYDNDKIYIINNFCITGFDESGTVDDEKTIYYSIGDKVFFLDWYYELVGQNICTKIKFRDEKGRVFSAVESFFVTEDIWEGLKNYFNIRRG